MVLRSQLLGNQFHRQGCAVEQAVPEGFTFIVGAEAATQIKLTVIAIKTPVLPLCRNIIILIENYTNDRLAQHWHGFAIEA